MKSYIVCPTTYPPYKGVKLSTYEKSNRQIKQIGRGELGNVTRKDLNSIIFGTIPSSSEKKTKGEVVSV